MAAQSIEAVEARINLLTLPTRPIKLRISLKKYVQEARGLSVWALPDRDAIVRSGVSEECIDDLDTTAVITSRREAEWHVQRFSREDAILEWDVKGPAAYNQRDRLLKSLRFVYRKDASILARLDSIAEGTGHADMVQDLYDLVALCKANPAPLAKANFDMARIAAAEELALAMGALLGSLTSDRLTQNEAKILRDKALFALVTAVDEVRAAGQELHDEDSPRYAGYESLEEKRLNAKRAAEAEAEAEAAKKAALAKGSAAAPTEEF